MQHMTIERLLRERGLLLLQHKSLPSVVGLVTGERLSTSWWSHPRAHEIFAKLEALDEGGDVIATRLIDRRVTLVHRRLWPAVLAAGSARESWQMRGLPRDAKALLRRVDGEKRVAATGPAAKLLQERLLVHAHEEHTPSGRHVTVLEPWSVIGSVDLSAEKGRKELAQAAVGIGAALTMLPWRRGMIPTRRSAAP
jgi:hypothetical protein